MKRNLSRFYKKKSDKILQKKTQNIKLVAATRMKRFEKRQL